MTTHDDPPPASHCANCGAALAIDPHPRYCPMCGQETRLHPPSFGEFVHEFVGHYVAFEGALWRTLGALLFRPGQLTREYLDGRRRRYVLPLRVYLSASFLFFVVVKFLGVGAGSDTVLSISPRPPETRPAAVVDADEARDAQAWVDRCARPDACSFIEHRAARASQRLSGPEGAKLLGERLAATAPYAVFLMLPLFAALMRVAWRRTRLPYGAHFVYGLHQHAFWFLLLLLLAPLPAGAGGWAVPVVFAYGALAMRRVYGAAWVPTIWRAAVVSLAYGFALTLGTVALAIAAVLLV